MYKRERRPCSPLHLSTSWEPSCTRTRKSHQFSQVRQEGGWGLVWQIHCGPVLPCFPQKRLQKGRTHWSCPLCKVKEYLFFFLPPHKLIPFPLLQWWGSSGSASFTTSLSYIGGDLNPFSLSRTIDPSSYKSHSWILLLNWYTNIWSPTEVCPMFVKIAKVVKSKQQKFKVF